MARVIRESNLDSPRPEVDGHTVMYRALRHNQILGGPMDWGRLLRRILCAIFGHRLVDGTCRRCGATGIKEPDMLYEPAP